jgi:hypothetical protein
VQGCRTKRANDLRMTCGARPGLGILRRYGGPCQTQENRRPRPDRSMRWLGRSRVPWSGVGVWQSRLGEPVPPHLGQQFRRERYSRSSIR